MTQLLTGFFSRTFWLSALAAGLWINASEIFRYFMFIIPMMREAFPMVENVAPINPLIFFSWMIWDTILMMVVTGFVWFYFEHFGSGVRNVIIAGSLVWVPIFVLLWLGLFNMNLATAEMIAVAWPLSWVEMVIAAMIIDQMRQRFG